MAPPAPAAFAGRPTRGVRIVIDLRPLQQPDRAPVTAAYLDNLLAAFDSEPLAGEELVALMQAGLPDPTAGLQRLPVAARRWLPPTRLLRAASLTVDPFLLRGASVAAGRASAGAVYHLAGASLPLASRLPVVATLLDLAPWELPQAYQGGPAAHLGERLRARLLRDASLIVGSEAVARSAARLLRARPGRIHVVPFAPNPAAAAICAGPYAVSDDRGFAAGIAGTIALEREILGLPDRYLILLGRYDARTDIPTLLDALAALNEQSRPAILSTEAPWPPVLLLAGARPEDRSSLMRAAGRRGLDGQLIYAEPLPGERFATVVAGARAAIRSAVSDAVGSLAIDAIACGTPVVASAVGALPEAIGGAGILVEPRDSAHMARAIEAVWSDDSLHLRLRKAATVAARELPTWVDVAWMTRAVYAAAAGVGTTAAEAPAQNPDAAAGQIGPGLADPGESL